MPEMAHDWLNKIILVYSMIEQWRRYDSNDTVPLLIGKLRAFVFLFQI